MKKLLALFLFIVVLLTTACTNSSEKRKDQKDKVHENAGKDTATLPANVKLITPLFGIVDPKNTKAFGYITDKYLAIKNALANNNSDGAKVAGKEMLDGLSGVDKSLLTAEERKAYGAEEDDLKENAGHIGESKIDHQRMHFSILSQSMYVIARSFGTAKPLYHFFCQKAENKEGAMWLSDSIDSNNPYLGNGSNCNELIEKIK